MVERRRQKQADRITVWSHEASGPHSVLLLSEAGAEQQDGTVTKLLATATEPPLRPGGSGAARSHSDTWWSR